MITAMIETKKINRITFCKLKEIKLSEEMWINLGFFTETL